MRRSFTLLILVVFLVGAAAAQDVMSVSLDPDQLLHAAWVGPDAPFDCYIYVEAQTANVGGYEASVEIDPKVALVLQATGPNGWTNFGDTSNHIVGYMTPVPVSGGIAVLSTLTLMILEPDVLFFIMLGPSTPSSFGDRAPGYADGTTPDDLYACETRVTIVNEVLDSEIHSLAEVKELFR